MRLPAKSVSGAAARHRGTVKGSLAGPYCARRAAGRGRRTALARPTPAARPSVTGRRGRCPAAARAAALAPVRRPARLPGRRHTRGHGPVPGSRAARRPRPGSGPGPACPSTSTGRPRSAHGRPVPSWRAVVPRHTARRAARRLRHCGVHRSPLHSQPDRGTVRVERADGSSGEFPRAHCSTRVGGGLRRAAATRTLRPLHATAGAVPSAAAMAYGKRRPGPHAVGGLPAAGNSPLTGALPRQRAACRAP